VIQFHRGTLRIKRLAPAAASASAFALLLTFAIGPLAATPADAATTVFAVGSLASKAGTDVTSLAVSPQHVGDLMVLFAKASQAGVSLSSISGGGVSTWTRAISYSGYANHDLEMWTGEVSMTGASPITVKFSSSVASTHTGLAAQEFSASAGVNSVWNVDTSGGISNAATTTVTFPKLTPSGSDELYFSYAVVANTASAGKTSGYAYSTTSDGDVAAYDVNVSSVQQPTATQSPTGVSGAIAVLIAAQGTTTPSVTAVTSVSPTSGSTSGGTAVTVTGIGFGGATAVKFGTNAASSFTVVSPTSISAVAPTGTGVVDVTITTPSGTSPTSASDKYTYASATPTVTSVSPTSGSTSGGTTVTVTGNGFSGATGVKFGTSTATSYTVTSNTSLTAVSPAVSGATTVDVTVTTLAGVSSTSSADSFTYISAVPQFSADNATPSGSVGSAYSYTYAASGTPAPTFAVTSGSLPPGLLLNSTSGLLSGTPTATTESLFTFVVSASNTAGTVTGTQQSITVSNTVVIQRATTFPVNSETTMNASITVDPQHVGDLMIVSDQLHSTSINVTGVTGGNSGTWHLAEQFIDIPNTLTYQVWYAVTTSTGSSKVTVTYSATTSLPVELIADSFTASRAVTWNVVAGEGVSNSTSTSVLFPTLTSGAPTGELYWGASEERGSGVAGSTPGFIYGLTNEANAYLYDASLSSNSAYAPSAGQTPAGVSTSVGVIFSAQ
jgi:hypothetical protein